jgi:hypothetical protein
MSVYSPEGGFSGSDSKTEAGSQKQKTLTSQEEQKKGRFLQLMADKVKKHKALTGIALSFLLTTQVARDAYSQDIPLKPDSPPSISFIELSKGKQVHELYKKEVRRLSALGYNFNIANEVLFNETIPTEVDLVEVFEIKRSEIEQVVGNPGNCLPEVLQKAGEDTKNACSLAGEHKEDAVWLSSLRWGGIDPFKALELLHGGKRDVDPKLLAAMKEEGPIDIPAFYLEERELPGDRVEVTFSNWINENPVVVKEVISFSEVDQFAWKILKSLPGFKKSSEEYLRKLKSEVPDEISRVYEKLGEEVLSSEQAEQLRRIFEKVVSIRIQSLPLNRMADAKYYGTNESELVLDRSFVQQESIPKIRINGQPRRIVIEAEKNPQNIDNIYKERIDQHRNLIKYFPAGLGDMQEVLIQTGYTVCNKGAVCNYRAPLFINLDYLGLPQLDDFIYVREQPPLEELFPEQAMYALYSNLSGEQIKQANLIEPLRKLYRGMQATEDLFGMRNKVVTGVYLPDFEDEYTIHVSPNDPKFVTATDEDLKRPDNMELIGRHEPWHSIDKLIQISDHPKFINLFTDKLGKALIPVEGKDYRELDYRSFIMQINEENFFKEEKGSDFGHAEKNQTEFLASLGNSIQDDENVWKGKVDARGEEFARDYFEALKVLGEILDERRYEGKVDPNIPLFEILPKRIFYLKSKINN